MKCNDIFSLDSKLKIRVGSNLQSLRIFVMTKFDYTHKTKCKTKLNCDNKNSNYGYTFIWQIKRWFNFETKKISMSSKTLSEGYQSRKVCNKFSKQCIKLKIAWFK